MRWYGVSLCVVWAVAMPVVAQTPPVVAGAGVPVGYAESWRDDFKVFDRAHWSRGLESDVSDAGLIWDKTTGGAGLLNDSYCGYITDEDAYVEGGSLILRNQKRAYVGESPARAFDYTSGWVNSMGKRSFNGTDRGVYLEVRAKFPAGLKVWPAVWLVTEQRHWPPEIDVWEYFGSYWTGPDQMYMRYIYPTTDTQRWKPENRGESSVPIKNFDRDYGCETWHTYGYQWDAQRMVWSIDGVVVRELKRSDLAAVWPDEAFCLVLNNAVATKPAEGDTVWPNTLEVDYVAVYERR